VIVIQFDINISKIYNEINNSLIGGIMPNLIFIEKGELVTTTLIVSKELKRVNKGIVRLIKEYEKDRSS